MQFVFNGGMVKAFDGPGRDIHPFAVEHVAELVRVNGKLNTIKLVLEIVRAFGGVGSLLECKHFVESVMQAKGIK